MMMQILPTSISAVAYAFVPQKQEQSALVDANAIQNQSEEQVWPTKSGDDSQTNKPFYHAMDSQTARVLAQLKAADREVRAHEQAHMAAGAGITGLASYTYKTGPDGKQYAVAGEVPVDTSAGRTPEETLAKAQKIRAAALAPAQPSAQDYKVAQTAAKMKLSAQAELLKLKEEEMQQQTEKIKNKYESVQNENQASSFSAFA